MRIKRNAGGAEVSSAGFFEVHIATHQRGSSGVDYRSVHRKMEANGFERLVQTTAQSANEVPGGYRLRQPQLTMEEVMERLRVILGPLGRGMSVRIVKVEEERVFDLMLPPTEEAPTGKEPTPKRSRSGVGEGEAQSGYPAWRRPR